MKVLTSTGLRKLIELIKSTFIKTEDVDEAILMDVDANPTSGSEHLVTSGGVYTALSGKQDASDNSLQTTSKNVVGAINEINDKVSEPFFELLYSVDSTPASQYLSHLINFIRQGGSWSLQCAKEIVILINIPLATIIPLGDDFMDVEVSCASGGASVKGSFQVQSSGGDITIHASCYGGIVHGYIAYNGKCFPLTCEASSIDSVSKLEHKGILTVDLKRRNTEHTYTFWSGTYIRGYARELTPFS